MIDDVEILVVDNDDGTAVGDPRTVYICWKFLDSKNNKDVGT